MFCNDTHRLVEANKVDVSQFDIIGADMDKEVRLYLAPLFAFNPASFEPPNLGMGVKWRLSQQISMNNIVLVSQGAQVRSVFGNVELSEQYLYKEIQKRFLH